MENRMQLIYDAASNLFINRGYSRTQMKDIAKDIKLSTGMLYVYFTGKKDILNFLLKGTIEPDFITRDFELPIKPELFLSLNNEIMEAFDENNRRFAAHLLDTANYPLEQMLSDAFEIISKYGVGCLLIEKNPDDVGGLSSFYKEYRREFFLGFIGYIKHYIEDGTFRKVEHLEYTVQLMIETISWWAMHIMNDAFEVRKDIPIEVAKAVCMDNLLNAYKT